MTDELQALLFPDDGGHTFAVIDGASCKELLTQLHEANLESVCLYAGELAPDIRRTAPHLVELLPGQPFTDWFVSEGFGRHWGIFARSPADGRALRKHFRRFLLVKNPEGKTLYFRYYDPRVLPEFLSTCLAQELVEFFGPVRQYLTEEPGGKGVAVWSLDGGRAQKQSFPTSH